MQLLASPREARHDGAERSLDQRGNLPDPDKLFNSSLDGNVRRAIDIHEGEEVDESAFKALVRQAIALNSAGKKKPAKKKPK